MTISMWTVLAYLLVLSGTFFISIRQDKVASTKALRKAWIFIALIPLAQGVMVFFQIFLVRSRMRMGGVSIPSVLNELGLCTQFICFSLALIFLMKALLPAGNDW